MIRSFFLFIIISICYSEFKSQRQYEVEQNLHAPCCWGGIIAEHDSPIANNIKLIIKEIISNKFNLETINSIINNSYEDKNIKNYTTKYIKENMTDEEIVNFFVGIHGEKIRALPENKGLGWVAWKLPIFILFSSIIIAILIIINFKNTFKETTILNKNTNFKKVDDEMKKMGI